MLIEKRNGTTQEFNRSKIEEAVRKVFYATSTEMPNGVDVEISLFIYNQYKETKQQATVEDVQDLVEDKLISMGFIKEAKAFIRYRQERTLVREEGWKMDDLQFAVWNNKYRYNEESFDEWLQRVSGGDQEVAKLIRDKKFLFGGRILANRGLQKVGKKVTFSNCYTLPRPQDNLESIFDTARDMAKTYAYGGGCGVDISNLRPRGMAVNNTARTTTGAVSFMDLYDLTTGTIGQSGRRGALMITISVDHPDVEEFIDVKTKQGSITKANISLRVTDEFMQAVKNREPFELRWEDNEGRKLKKTVDAYELYKKNVANNWDWAEAGFLFWDTISEWHMMSEMPNYEFSTTNPCSELPLVANGSCLLGSINLSEFVVKPFTPEAHVDLHEFHRVVRVAVRALNDVLDEGESLHPLQAQRDTVRDWRQIGCGIMGFADMLIKLGITYGSKESIQLIKRLGAILSNASVTESATIASERGSFGKFDFDTWVKSAWVQHNLTEDVIEFVKENGLRNSQILTIAPTGSLSTLLGISGGAEPIFAKSYTRKTESVHNEDVYYEVHTPIVKQALDTLGHIPDYVVTSHDVPWRDRIAVQSEWQVGIDSAISSTINLPKEFTVGECEELFLEAWDKNLKGVTIFRDGCKRTGILTLDEPDQPKEEQEDEKVYQDDNKYTTCQECGEKIEVIQNGCTICMNCGHSPC